MSDAYENARQAMLDFRASMNPRTGKVQGQREMLAILASVANGATVLDEVPVDRLPAVAKAFRDAIGKSGSLAVGSARESSSVKADGTLDHDVIYANFNSARQRAE